MARVAFAKVHDLNSDQEWMNDQSCEVDLDKKVFRIIKKVIALDLLDLSESYEEHIETFKKVLYKNKNQHRVTKFYQHLETLKRRLYCKNDIKTLNKVLSSFQKGFFVKDKKHLFCKTVEHTNMILQSLIPIQTYFNSLMQHCIRTAEFLQSEIEKEFFLPLTVTSMGFVAYFYKNIENYNEILEYWISLLQESLSTLPSKDVLSNIKINRNSKPKESSTFISEEFSDSDNEEMGELKEKSSETSNNLIFNFLSIPTSKKSSKNTSSIDIPSESKKKKKNTVKNTTKPRGNMDSIFNSLLGGSISQKTIEKNKNTKKNKKKIN